MIKHEFLVPDQLRGNPAQTIAAIVDQAIERFKLTDIAIDNVRTGLNELCKSKADKYERATDGNNH